MSLGMPTGRGRPRWSLVAVVKVKPAPMAGLPGGRASVGVGPPLLASVKDKSRLALVTPLRKPVVVVAVDPLAVPVPVSVLGPSVS